LDSPKTTRTGTRTRRKIFSCPVCDEVFVDEESLRRHELTHQNADAPAAEEEAGGGESPPAPSAEPVAAAPAPEPAESSAPAPAAEASEGRPVRTLSSVRRQAQQQQAQAAQVEAPSTFLETEQPALMPVDPDATQAVLPSELGPMGWEPEQSASGGGLGRAWGALEDFSEWVVRGCKNTLGFVGSSVVSGLQLALRGLLVLALAAGCLYLGTWFGRVYGPRLWGQPVDAPVIPPTRTVGTSPKDARASVRQLVEDFYAAIDSADYKKAYGCLSNEWRKELSYDAFARGYRDTKKARCDVKDVRSLPGGRYQVDVALEVVDSKGKPQRLQGSYVAVLGSAGWRLDEGGFR
jgi:hypothetical protein